MTTGRRSRPGRPRHSGGDSDLSPREHILDVSARLFVSQGFAATSTREIAEEVGIRQASLYYHFAGKDQIVAELLEQTVRPALDSIAELDEAESPEAALYGLALRDATTLAGLPHNIGVLPNLPDVAASDACQEYQAARRDLRDVYASLAVACASDVVRASVEKRQLGELIIRAVEGVVDSRVAGEAPGDKELHAVAASCLRVCDVPQDRIKVAREAVQTP